jgi:hypothetical protein
MPTNVDLDLQAKLKPEGAKYRWWVRRETRQYHITIPPKSGINHRYTMTYIKKLRQEAKRRGLRRRDLLPRGTVVVDAEA